MKRLCGVAVGVVCALAACGIIPNQGARQAQQQRAQANRWQAQQQQAYMAEAGKVVHPECGSKRTGMGTVQMIEGGATYRCGTLWSELGTPTALADFVRDLCGGVDDQACFSKFQTMFFARMAERYEYISWEYLSRKCEAYPRECALFKNIEAWAIESHNSGALEQGRRAAAAVNQEMHAEYERQRAIDAENDRRARAAFAAALQGMSGGLSAPYRNRVTCTSNTTGTTTTTSCQ
jgi:hypothetical protein